MKTPRRLKAPKGEATAYEQLWRVVDGAVRDAFMSHPDYISRQIAERTVRMSVVKRVTGAVAGFAVQAARGRSLKEAAEMERGVEKSPVQSSACKSDEAANFPKIPAKASGSGWPDVTLSKRVLSWFGL